MAGAQEVRSKTSAAMAGRSLQDMGRLYPEWEISPRIRMRPRVCAASSNPNPNRGATPKLGECQNRLPLVQFVRREEMRFALGFFGPGRNPAQHQSVAANQGNA